MFDRMKRSHWVEDAARGLASGFVASWIMEKAQSQISKLGGAATKEREERAMNDEPATARAAEAAARGVGVDLDDKGKATGGRIVHYTYGAGWGAAYALLSRRVRFPLIASGLAFGGLLWLLSDEGLVPLFGLSKSPRSYPASVHLKALLAHLVYGTATAVAERVLPR